MEVHSSCGRAQRCGETGHFASVDRYYLHRLNLALDEETLWGDFTNHVARKIRRGEREACVQEGRSNTLLKMFYELLLQTRRRHGLPPTHDWFRAVLDRMDEQAKIRVAFKDRAPVAAIMTLRHGNTMMYKYGASDAASHPLGGMHFLFWQTIKEARSLGCVSLGFGAV